MNILIWSFLIVSGTICGAIVAICFLIAVACFLSIMVEICNEDINSNNVDTENRSL
jgi:hypothetical protein